MKKTMVAATLSLILLNGGEALAIPATYSGTTVGGPEWVRPFENGSCSPCSSAGPVRYDVQPFYTNYTGAYDISSVQYGFDGYIFIYQTNFDPTNQTANFVAGDDDGVDDGVVGTWTSNIDNVNLLSATEYFFVTTGFRAGDEGTFDNTISDLIGSAIISFGLIPVYFPPLYLPPNGSGYWDINDTTPGAGGPTPHGSWQQAKWTTSIDGTLSIVNWRDGSDAFFSAGHDAIDAFTVDLDAPVIVRDMRVRDGQVTILATSPGNTVTFDDPRDGESTISTAQGTSLVFDTNVSSAANLAKDGGGRVDFNGQTNVDGTLSLQEGTVQVNGTMNTGATDNAGILVINSTTTTGALTNAGALSLNGIMTSGIVTNYGAMHVNGTMTNSFTDNSGNLVVNGTLISPVSNRGYLGGTGVINGNVANSGIISPGNSIGQLTINGSYAHFSNAILLTEIDENGRSDKLNVNGRVTLNGGVVRTSLPRSLYPDGFAWNILSAGGGVAGRFDSIQGQPNSETVNLVLVNTGNGVNIQVDRVSYGTLGKTVGQQETGAGLDKIVPLARHRGDAMENLLVNMDFGSSAQQVSEVLVALSPEIYTSFKVTAGQAAQRFSSKLLSRNAKFKDAKLLLSSTELPNAGLSGVTMLPSNQDTTKTATTPQNAQEAGSEEMSGSNEQLSPRWMVWAEYANTNAEHNSGEQYLGYKDTTNAIYLGLDSNISSIFRLGFGFGATGTNLDWDQPGASGDQTGILAGVYSAIQLDAVYFDASISFGRYDNEASRVNPINANTQPISADFNAFSWLGQLGMGYDIVLGGNWLIGPKASLMYLNIKSDDFKEQNGNYLNLNFEDDTDDTVITSLGGRVATQIEAWGLSFLPQLESAWIHDGNGKEYTVGTSFRDFQNAAFSVSGAGAGKDVFSSNIGIIALMNERLTGNIQAGADLAEDYHNVVFSCGLVMNF